MGQSGPAAGYFARLATPVPPAALVLRPAPRTAATLSAAPLEVLAPVSPPRAIPPASAQPDSPRPGDTVLAQEAPTRAVRVVDNRPGATQTDGASHQPGPVPPLSPPAPEEASAGLQPPPVLPEHRHMAPRLDALPDGSAPPPQPAWQNAKLRPSMPVDGRSAPPVPSARPAPEAAIPNAQMARTVTPPPGASPRMSAPEAVALAPAPGSPSAARPPTPLMPEPPVQRRDAARLRPAAAEPAAIGAGRSPAQSARRDPPSIHIGVVEVRAAPPPPPAQIMAPRAARAAGGRSVILSRGFGQRFGFGQS